MAGTHQIWGYFPEGMIWWKFRKFEPLACVSLIGNGLEENRNNSYPHNAAFAQPSGLAIAKDFLYIADSESSSIRKASMLDGKVMPVVGGDRNPLNLFAFGDVDGKQYAAKLQHPLGVTYNNVTGKVYIADTYNHKIKAIETDSNTVETILINTSSGEPYKFNEPAGLCFDASGQKLLIADTNNHSLQIVDMRKLTIKPFPLTFNTSETDAPMRGQGKLLLIKRLNLRKCKSLSLKVHFALTDGLKFTANAPQKWKLSASNSGLHAVTPSGILNGNYLVLQLQRLNSVVPQQEEQIKLDISLSLCNAKCCLMKRFSLLVVGRVESGVENELSGIPVEENLNVYVSPGDIKLV